MINTTVNQLISGKVSNFRKVRRPAKLYGFIHCFRVEKQRNMNKMVYYFFCLIVYAGTLSTRSCQTHGASGKEKSHTFSSEIEEVEVKYAKNFEVRYFKDCKPLTITKVFQDSNETVHDVLPHPGKKAAANFKKAPKIVPPQPLPKHKLFYHKKTEDRAMPATGTAKKNPGKRRDYYDKQRGYAVSYRIDRKLQRQLLPENERACYE